MMVYKLYKQYDRDKCKEIGEKQWTSNRRYAWNSAETNVFPYEQHEMFHNQAKICASCASAESVRVQSKFSDWLLLKLSLWLRKIIEWRHVMTSKKYWQSTDGFCVSYRTPFHESRESSYWQWFRRGAKDILFFFFLLFVNGVRSWRCLDYSTTSAA